MHLKLIVEGSYTEDVTAEVPLVPMGAFCHYLPDPSDPTRYFVSAINLFSEEVPGARAGWILFYRDDDGNGTAIEPTVTFRAPSGAETLTYYDLPAYRDPGTRDVASTGTGALIHLELVHLELGVEAPERVRVDADIECPPPA